MDLPKWQRIEGISKTWFIRERGRVSPALTGEVPPWTNLMGSPMIALKLLATLRLSNFNLEWLMLAPVPPWTRAGLEGAVGSPFVGHFPNGSEVRKDCKFSAGTGRLAEWVVGSWRLESMIWRMEWEGRRSKGHGMTFKDSLSETARALPL